MSAERSSHRSRGAALIIVLFLVMAVSVIALGLFARTDFSLAAGCNFVLHTQTETLAYSGLEFARVLVREPNLVEAGPVWDAGFRYEVEISAPSERVYPVTSRAWFEKDGSRRAESILTGWLYYDPNDGGAYYQRIDRQVR
ncbi:MAG TPA: hypothetical protein PK054_03410 [Anaerohalosphaeraceae bacterium]|nr:hypothetical protein [Anaerohalosphaeraceae bacterium]HOL89413.1 hypothetical protein [Anaerohalosphaeraceae bacterium]HPP55609.1 hypothetical protein [Anaerohalosphaeraceae bacterium]